MPLFLYEAGDISQEIQTKLLRFLQEWEFEYVGGTKPISVDVRIIAATNRNLEVSVKEGLFREDLYHRLNVVPIALPPLRERKEDIPALSQYFLQKYAIETRKHFSEITSEAKEKLSKYDWPGNVRELANVIERAIVLGSGPNITIEDLPGIIVAAETGSSKDDLSYHGAINAARREVVLRALAQSRGNRSAAAKLLGLNTKYFLRLFKSLRIE